MVFDNTPLNIYIPRVNPKPDGIGKSSAIWSTGKVMFALQ